MGRIGRFVDARQRRRDATPSWLARDRLAHELMYLSRGNPVIYYGDEQGFTGDGGDQLARQDMFPSRVPEYLDDDLIGTDATHAQDNFDPRHPLLPVDRRGSRRSTRPPPGAARRRPAAPLRRAGAAAGVYAFSRIDRREQREYVVALNNAETAKTRGDPDLRRAAPLRRGSTATGRVGCAPTATGG